MSLRDIVGIVRHDGLRRFAAQAIAASEPVIAIRNRLMCKRHLSKPFTFVGLMLSRECHANCIFCPVPTKLRAVENGRFMTMEVARKVAADLARIKYSGEINFGENGDALLNPKFKDIVRLVSAALPHARLVLYTNMMHLDRDMATFLLENRLSSLVLNMDGATEATYRLSKPGLHFETVRRNLHDYIATRNAMGSKCAVNISVIAPRRYIELRRQNKPEGVLYDAPDVIRYWTPYLSEGDSITEPAWLFNWNTGATGRKRTSCPPIMFNEVLSNMFIATDGRAYLCCMDYSTRQTYGNIMDQPVMEIWNSPERHRLVKAIAAKRFAEMGRPCACCQETYDYMQCYGNLLKHRNGV